MITEFLKPKTIAEAIHFKQAYPDAVFMAGGSWINSCRSKLNPETVICIAGIGLNTIKKEKQFLTIGAMTTQQEVLDNPMSPEPLKAVITSFRNRNIRNQATMGGAVAAREPSFSILSLLFAVNAELDLADGSVVTVEKYLENPINRLILSVRVPLDAKACFAKHSVTARGVALLTVAAGLNDGELTLVLAQDGGKIERLTAVEEQLKGKKLPDRETLEKLISKNVNSFDDYRTSADFKKYTAGVLLADCLIKLYDGE